MSRPAGSAKKVDTISLHAITQSLFRFTLTTILLMSLTFIVISSLVIRSTLDELYERFAAQEANSLQFSLNQIVEAKLSTLIDHASLPFVVNAVMQANENSSSVIDYMENLRILNNDADIVLLDINGEVIHSTSELQSYSWQTEKWVSDIVDAGLPHFVSVYETENGAYARMAVPVMYNNYTEGVLVGITRSMLGGAFDELIDDPGMVATVMSNGEAVHTSGVLREGPSFVKELELPAIHGSLRLVVYKTAITTGLTRLFFLGAIAGLLACVLFILVFRRLGIKLVIEPQQQLERSRIQTIAANEKLGAANEKLGAANEELAQFSYRASHDLKAPLVSARGLAELVGEDIKDGDYIEAQENSKKIGKQLRRLERLVTDILSLAKADLQDSIDQHVNLTELLNEINERLELLFSDNGVRIEVQVDPETIIYTSRSRLSQVLENLISNGVKYSNPEQRDRYVLVQATKSDHATEIVVKDNGLGIPLEFHGQVFDMFKRFHPSVSFGSGLGMYIIKKQIDNMNASLDFESSSEGTVFRVSLPDSELK